MKSMLLLSQCMDLKAKVADLGHELRILVFLVVTVLALSVSKVVYYHCSSQQNVRKIKQLLESSRPQRRSGDLCGSGPASPLPKIERVPVCLSLRRRSSVDPSVNITEIDQNRGHTSSADSIKSMQTLQRSSSTDRSKLVKPDSPPLRSYKADSPPSRSHMKSSTSERTETEHRRRKNQIIAAEMLM